MAKAFVVTGKKLGIKTIGIQHGNFLQSQSDYMMKNIRTDNNLIGNPISDLTLVFGDHYKKMLHQFGNYPLDKIHVTGNLTLYNLDKIKNILDSLNYTTEIINRNGFDLFIKNDKRGYTI